MPLFGSPVWRRTSIPQLAAALSLLLIACGGDDDGATALPTPVVFASEPADVVDGEAPGGMFAPLEAILKPNIPSLAEAFSGPTFATGEVIGVGGVATESIDGQPVFPGVCLGAKARLLGATDRGESSFTLEWFGCTDDAGFDDRTESAMSRLLFREPFAVVPLASDRFFDEADLNEQRIPYVGVGSQPAFCGVENGFGFAVTGASGCPVLDAIGIATSGPVLQAYLAGTGIAPAELRVAHIVGSSVAGQETAAARRLEVESVGATLVIVDSTLRLAALASDADLRNVAEGVLAAQPDVIIVEVDGGDRVYRFLREAGFSGDIVGVGYDPLQALTDQDIRARQAGTFQVVPGRAVVPQDTDEWDKLIDDARRVELSAEFVGLGFVSGYASMDFFLAALAEVEEPVSRERFHDLVNRGWEYPGIEGVVCASSWPTAHLLAAPCASMVFINSDGAPEVVLPATMFQLIMEEQR